MPQKTSTKYQNPSHHRKNTPQNSHAPSKTSRNILIAFLLNLGFSIYEFFGGVFTGSTAIMSDAIHDFGDALSIGIAFFLEKKSQKHPDSHYTYGYLRYSLVGGFITTFILLLGSSFVIFNAILHLIHPITINYSGMIILAVIGVVINFIAAYFTHTGNSLNQKAVNLHMLEDVLGWVVVLIGAIIMKFTNISYLDPILSILVALFILKNAFMNLHDILNIFLEKTPANISIDKIQQHLLNIKNIQDVHHIHLWSMDGEHNYATLHIVTTRPSPTLKANIKNALAKHHITHTTVEFESPDEHCHDDHCEIAPLSHTSHHHH